MEVVVMSLEKRLSFREGVRRFTKIYNVYFEKKPKQKLAVYY